MRKFKKNDLFELRGLFSSCGLIFSRNFQVPVCPAHVALGAVLSTLMDLTLVNVPVVMFWGKTLPLAMTPACQVGLEVQSMW